MIFHKVFAECLKFFHHDVRKLRRVIDDKRMSYDEKRIIYSYLALRDGKSAETVAMLESLPGERHPFVEAHRLLGLGMAYNNMSYYQKAVGFVEEAIELFAQEGIHYHSFLLSKPSL